MLRGCTIFYTENSENSVTFVRIEDCRIGAMEIGGTTYSVGMQRRSEFTVKEHQVSVLNSPTELTSSQCRQDCHRRHTAEIHQLFRRIQEPFLKGGFGGGGYFQIDCIHPTIRIARDAVFRAWLKDESWTWATRYSASPTRMESNIHSQSGINTSRVILLQCTGSECRRNYGPEASSSAL